MKPQRNSFEMKAHDIQYRKPRPSWDHTIETYQGNTGTDWFFYGAMTVYFLFFGAIILALYGII